MSIVAKGIFIGAGKTIKFYYLTARGDKQYPYLTNITLSSHQKHPQVCNRIVGEIYEVNEDGLSTLDVLEEYPIYYNRHMIGIQNLSSTNADQVSSDVITMNTIQCYAYFLENKDILATIRHEFNINYFDVANGDWKQYLLSSIK